MDERKRYEGFLAEETEESAEAVWRAQTRAVLPLIEFERRAYIESQRGRLDGVLGKEYWDGRAKAYRVLTNPHTQNTVAEPDELDIHQLCVLPVFSKRIEMLGTVSSTAFFSVAPKDQERLAFLAALSDRLARGGICTENELTRLFTEHAAFINRG